MRLEVVQVPVADVDRSKSFYTEKLGFVLDHDVEYIPGMRVVQLTPPGSAASIVVVGNPQGGQSTLTFAAAKSKNINQYIAIPTYP